MKSAHELERLNDLSPTTGERLEELEEMPDEKLAELHAAPIVRKVQCEECSEETWLIGPGGSSCTSECHNCGTEYRIG
ncbi:hypothetical protein [Natrinema sp. DC36]|uniref:hypothetical protein n=1 Tax=Natrinema sp. DC36 TaxID=2878680 RepID=UPI001CF07FAE|nr:hypothetical protein [Natrinema sp. DC36]